MGDPNIKESMNFNKAEFFSNPHSGLDLPPLHFDIPDDKGWMLLARSIVEKGGNMKQYVQYAKRRWSKEKEWKALSFLNPKVQTNLSIYQKKMIRTK